MPRNLDQPHFELEPQDNKGEFFITRHSKKPKGEDVESKQYPGISEKGIELAEQRAETLAEMVEDSGPGSVMFISGGTELVRTKSTAEAYGDRLKEIMADRKDVVVMTRSEIKDQAKGKGIGDTVRAIVAEIKNNPDKKVVVDFPLFLKDMSPIVGGFFTKEGKLTPWTTELLADNDNDEYKAFRKWVETKGNTGRAKGPDPEDTAKRYAKGLNRLRDFARKQLGGERPLVVGTVGHSWDIDVFLTYMAEGKVDLESFDKISDGSIINETELAQITIDGGNTEIKYRGKEFQLKK